MNTEHKPHVVVIGGGFAGLYAARRLSRLPVRVTLLDRRNHHLFQPLLYQVATAALSPANIAQPIRNILRRCRNVRVELAEARAIDVASKTVILADGVLTYDYLLLACGATDNYFGHPEWEAVAPGLKSLEAATTIRSRFLLAFEKAARESDPERRKALLTFVIVGGGPTGVELAGTMAEVAHTTLARDFPDIDHRAVRILLLEGGPRVLATYPPDLSQSAQRQLERLGVEVRVSALVDRMDDHAVYIGSETIPTHNVFWAAGVRANDLGKTLGAPTDRAGRTIVGSTLNIADHPEVFVLGDAAAATDGLGQKVPGVAPAAMQMGSYAADCIEADLKRQGRPAFVYWDKGSLATIGRASAVGEFGRVHISGFLAWLAWLLVHVYFLIGFENRLMVLWQWAFAYLSFQRAARLITYTDESREDMKAGVGPISTRPAEKPTTVGQ